MKKRITRSFLLILCLPLLGSRGISQQVAATDPVTNAVPTAKIEWMSFEEALNRCQTEPKKLMIDVYTEWCGWCKRMDATTFVDPLIVQEVNQNFYAVKFDAEQKGTITFKEKDYKFLAQGTRGYHELAAAMLDNKLSYPSMVFMDEKQNMIQSMSGYQTPAQLDPVLNYFGVNYYQTVPWNDFLAKYKSPIGN